LYSALLHSNLVPTKKTDVNSDRGKK